MKKGCHCRACPGNPDRGNSAPALVSYALRLTCLRRQPTASGPSRHPIPCEVFAFLAPRADDVRVTARPDKPAPPPDGTRRVLGACALDCPDTCSWVVTVKDGRAVKLEGDRDHPFTRG